MILASMLGLGITLCNLDNAMKDRREFFQGLSSGLEAKRITRVEASKVALDYLNESSKKRYLLFGCALGFCGLGIGAAYRLNRDCYRELNS